MISGIYTGVMLVVFLGIVVWAWSKSNQTKFDEISRSVLKDDDELTGHSVQQNEEKNNE